MAESACRPSDADLDALRAVVRSVAHDLRNRLQVVALGSSFAATRAADADAAAALADSCVAADHALRLVRQLEALVSERVDDGPAEVPQAVRTAAAVLEHTFLRRGVALGVDLSPETPPVRLSRVELTWLVLRLLHDAVPSRCQDAVRLVAGREGAREAFIELQASSPVAAAAREALTELAQRSGGRLEARATVTRLVLPAALPGAERAT